MVLTVQNQNFFLKYEREEKHIFMRDLTDSYNEPALYNTTVRGLEKAFQHIVSEYEKNKDLTFSEVWDLLHNCKIRTHYWCMMD